MEHRSSNNGGGSATDDVSATAKRAAAESRQHGFATFRELYRSRDGRIIIYEDAEGHLTAVNTSRLA